ncbi:HET-domain-containing protein [Rhizopogon vinicolor AM-OR11-026]|uniref:HET-domain-containing protein n=1 Tax=Rhizopogon vinicolor AM-OR11-026 TaxID=1314800 RepID=A0A1B7MSD4_9AGAM|nr:HET-domain-containing protein [Rhizopogon vinicolor AM-OR11-026]
MGLGVDAAIYSPDETMIATSAANPEKEVIKIWDAKTGSLITALKHRSGVTRLAWTGRMIISKSLDGSIGMWNTTTWQQITVLTEHDIRVHAIAISPNGYILASAMQDTTLRLWNLENGRPIGSPLQHVDVDGKWVSCLSFSADGNLLTTGCFDNNAYSWDISEIVREPRLNELPLNPNDGDRSLPYDDHAGDATRRPGQQLKNGHQVFPVFDDDSPNHPHSSGRRITSTPSTSPPQASSASTPQTSAASPPPTSSARPPPHAPRPTFLGHISSQFQRTHTNASSLRPAPSSTLVYNDDDAPLCSICSALDIRAILHDGVPKEHSLPLGLLTDILSKQDQCALCRLIAFVIRRTGYLDKNPRSKIAWITCGLYAEPAGSINAYECKDLGIPDSVLPVRKDLCHRLRVDIFLPHLDIQLLEEDAFKVGRTKELHGRRVTQTVDIDLLKSWIHICENEHGEKCETTWWRNPGEVLPKSIRIIDVARMAIIPAPRSCRYVALSYLWGGTGEEYRTTKANLKQRSRKGGLNMSVLPPTIRDTIQVVRQLGERYLWIDALCIVQDDHKDKKKQIGAMERVYGFATFTIFAAGGTSVHDPLPGVRPGTRDPKQQIAKVQGLHLAVPLILPKEAVMRSAWYTRGWTYQELMLSRRRIFFTTHHMYFECMKDVFAEDVVAEPINFPWNSHPVGYKGMDKFMPLGRGWSQREAQSAVQAERRLSWGAPATRYMVMVEEYTQRRLTLESDIVDAITALLNAMTNGYQWGGGNPRKAFRFGISVDDFERALVWQPVTNAPHERRVSADGNRAPWPSWSWTAWRGAVRYDGGDLLTEQGNSLDIQESLVAQWHIVDNDGKLVRMDVWHPIRVDKNDHWAIYLAPKGDLDARQLISEKAPLQPGTLVFRTSSARFNVAKADDITAAEANYAVYSILSDIPQTTTRIGRVFLPRSIHSPTSFEFIVLSRTMGRPGLFDEDILDEHRIWKRLGYHSCMFYVMAVQKIRDEERMERVGVGLIFDRAWVNSTTEQKVVFLG